MMRSLLFVFVLLLAACSRPPEHTKVNVKDLSRTKEDRLEVIAQLEKEALTTGDTLNPDIAQQLMIGYLDFATVHREDSMSGEYIFRAAEIAMNLGKYRTAIRYFTEVHDGFPLFDKHIEAGYMVPFIYDVHINDRGLAREMYGRIAEAYPDHPLGREATLRLNTLGMTDDQMIELFKKKNGIE